jgi:hypothetical protein
MVVLVVVLDLQAFMEDLVALVVLVARILVLPPGTGLLMATAMVMDVRLDFEAAR